jgi:hypothetical protein
MRVWEFTVGKLQLSANGGEHWKQRHPCRLVSSGGEFQRRERGEIPGPAWPVPCRFFHGTGVFGSIPAYPTGDYYPGPKDGEEAGLMPFPVRWLLSGLRRAVFFPSTRYHVLFEGGNSGVKRA